MSTSTAAYHPSDPKTAANDEAESLKAKNAVTPAVIRSPALNLSGINLMGTLFLQIKAFLQIYPQARTQPLYFVERCSFAEPSGRLLSANAENAAEPKVPAAKRPRALLRELGILRSSGYIPAQSYADYCLKDGIARRAPRLPPVSEESFFILPVGAAPLIYQALIDLNIYPRLRSFREQLPELDKLITLICLQVMFPQAVLTAKSCQDRKALYFYLNYLKDPTQVIEKLGMHYTAAEQLPQEQMQLLGIQPDFCYLRTFDTPVGILPGVRLTFEHSFEWQHGTAVQSRMLPLTYRSDGMVFISSAFKTLQVCHALLILRDVDITSQSELGKAFDFGSRKLRNKHYTLIRLTEGLDSCIFTYLGRKHRPHAAQPKLPEDCILRQYVPELDELTAAVPPTAEKRIGQRGFAALSRLELPKYNGTLPLYLHVFYCDDFARLKLEGIQQEIRALQQHWLTHHEILRTVSPELVSCINKNSMSGGTDSGETVQPLRFKERMLNELFIKRAFIYVLSPIDLPLDILYTVEKQCREQDQQMDSLYAELEDSSERYQVKQPMYYIKGRCLLSWCAQLVRQRMGAGLLGGRAQELLSQQEADELLDNCLWMLRSLELIVEGGGLHLSLPLQGRGSGTELPGLGRLNLEAMTTACQRVLRKYLKSPQFQKLQTLSKDELTLFIK